jgi:hypothetical protein
MTDLEKAKFDWYKSRIDKSEEDTIKLLNRAIDYEYVKMTAVIILMIIILYYITCQFGFGVSKNKQINTLPSSSVIPAQIKEEFSPYESTLVHDMYKSDASGDVPSANPEGRSNEKMLFDQLVGWAQRP